MLPLASNTTPDPKSLSVAISTTDGRTFLTMFTKLVCRATASSEEPFAAVVDVVEALLAPEQAAAVAATTTASTPKLTDLGREWFTLASSCRQHRPHISRPSSRN